MRIWLVLASALLSAVGATSQQVPKPPAQAQCRFSDGSSITVTYALDLKSYRFVTDGSLLSVKGMHVPAGDYAVSPTKDSADHWTLMMKKPIMKPGVWVLPLPMSVALFSSPTSGFPVFFDHTGGSCRDALDREAIRGGAFARVHQGERRPPSRELGLRLAEKSVLSSCPRHGGLGVGPTSSTRSPVHSS